MSSAPEPPSFKNEPPKENDFRNPGLRGVRTTTLFRAVNPELFIKPVRNIHRIRLMFNLTRLPEIESSYFPVTFNFTWKFYVDY